MPRGTQELCVGVQFACGKPLSEPAPWCGAVYPEGEGHPLSKEEEQALAEDEVLASLEETEQ